MDQETIKRQIASNISTYRKRAGMTQAELAQKLNYSDKAVSKWERAESLPDVMTLVLLAEALNVSTDQLVCPQDESAGGETENKTEAPAEPGKKHPKKKEKKPPCATLSSKRKIIGALSSTLVWFLALLTFQILSDAHVPMSWIGFVIAIPVNAIVLLSLLSAWRYYRRNQLLISVIMWGCILSLFTILWVSAGRCFFKLFLLGLPGQLAICLWFLMLRKEEKK